MIGTVLDGRYHLLRLLGEGGMGVVYEAIHEGTGRRVAVKVIAKRDLSADDEMVVRFQREAKAAGRLETPHIAQVLDASRDTLTGLPFLVMEFLVGLDLKDTVCNLGPLPTSLALRIAGQACVGLSMAHEQNIVHRDIKPANLFLARQQNGQVVVKLLDFGIAKLPPDLLASVEQGGVTVTGRLLGSPRFMSPEQAKGLKTLDHRTDIWSLGAVLYEALTGSPPFAEFETVGQLIVALCSSRPREVQEIAPWVSNEAAGIVRRAMQIDPDDRFPNVPVMLDEIRSLLPGELAINQAELVGVPTSVDPRQVTPKATTTKVGIGTPGRKSVSPKGIVELGAGSKQSAALVPSGAASPAREPTQDGRSERSERKIQDDADQVSVTDFFMAEASAPGPAPRADHTLASGGAAGTRTLRSQEHGPNSPISKEALVRSSSVSVVVPRSPWSRWPYPAAAVAVVLLSVGAVVWWVHGPSRSFGRASDWSNRAGPQGSVLASAPVLARESSSRPTEALLVHLSVSPPGVRAEVDGEMAEVQGGTISIRGLMGSVHRVRIQRGTTQKLIDVAITEAGPVPSRIEVDPPADRQDPSSTPGQTGREPTRTSSKRPSALSSPSSPSPSPSSSPSPSPPPPPSSERLLSAPPSSERLPSPPPSSERLSSPSPSSARGSGVAPKGSSVSLPAARSTSFSTLDPNFE